MKKTSLPKQKQYRTNQGTSALNAGIKSKAFKSQQPDVVNREEIQLSIKIAANSFPTVR